MVPGVRAAGFVLLERIAVSVRSGRRSWHIYSNKSRRITEGLLYRVDRRVGAMVYWMFW